MSRKAAWFSATSAMYDTFKKTTDRYELSAKDKLIEFLKYHPAFMYDMFDVEVMITRGELRYVDKNTGKKAIKQINKDDLLSFPSVSFLINAVGIKPGYADVESKLSIFRNKIWSYYYEDIDPTTDKHIHVKHNLETSGLMIDSATANLCINASLLRKINGGKWNDVKVCRKIEKHKLFRKIHYVEVELFDGVFIKFAVTPYTSGGYKISTSEKEFYLLNSDSMFGMIRSSAELMQQIHEALLEIDENYK